MTTATTSRRPVIVTIALVFVYVSGLSNTAIGIVVLLSRYQVSADAVLPVSLLGAGIILFGLLILALASGVSRGSRLARTTLTVYLAVIFALQALTIVSTDWDWVSVTLLGAVVFILIALWAKPGSRYFRLAAA